MNCVGLAQPSIVRLDELNADLVPDYLFEVHAGIEEMYKLLDSNELAAARRIAHNIAGAGGSPGIQSLADLCREIERAGEKWNESAMREGVDRLSAYMNRLEVRYPAQMGAAQ